MSVWEYTITVAGTAVDCERVLRPLTIRHGRTTIGTQPDAPACEFDWHGADPPGLLGDTLTVTLELVGSGPDWIWDAPANYTYDNGGYVYDNAWRVAVGPRFTGRIQQLNAQEAGGVVVGWRVSALGTQASWGQKNVTITRPVETDIARVTGIATAAGATLTILGTDTVTLAADAIDRPPLGAWQEVCASSGGLVWQARDGGMRYGASDHRRTDPAGVLPCEAIDDGIDWVQDVESVLNHLTVTWGPEGAETQNTHSDAPSMSQWGQRHADVPTMAAAQADADQLALLILARRAQPYWIMPGVQVDATTADLPVQHLLAALDVGTRILAPIPVDPGPVPTPQYGAWIVEGWTEHAGEDMTTTLALHLTDAARWADTRLRTWDEARAYTWAQEAAGTWLDALVVEGF